MNVQTIQVNQIKVDPLNNVSRESFAPESCTDLAASIEVHGLQSPVVVRPLGENQHEFALVCGFRRFTAVSVNLGREQIEASIVECTAEEGRVLNAVENLQRKDLTFWEECMALHKSFPPETTNMDIAQKLSKSRTWARARWLVWKLPKEVVNQVQAGLLGAADISILVQQSPEDQARTASKIIKGKAAGDTLDNMQRKLTNRGSRRPKREVKRIMTQCMEQGYDEAVQALRYATAEISDTLLFEMLEKTRNKVD